MKRILVTGSNGQLGSCLQDMVKANPNPNFEFIFANKEVFDLEKKEVIESYFFSNQIDCLINCAAYTAVDAAEKDVEKAFKINADAVGYMAQECAEQGTTFIHVSTDYVFNGQAEKPYKETDLTQPLGVYGKSKLEGERLAMDINPKSIIIRTAWVYSQYGKNFLKTMIRLFNEKEELSIVEDQMGSPTNANDLAKAIYDIVVSGKKTPGIYHYTNDGITNWYGFAKAIKEIIRSNIQLNPVPTSAYPTPAERPAYSVLDKRKIVATFGVETPYWKNSLEALIKHSFKES